MTQTNLYQDIQQRTSGALYLGVIGPVRSGKSTFIKKFIETLVLPSIEDKNQRDRAIDELPQSAAGKTIMTTEPKFVPEQPVQLNIDETAHMSVRLIDCVGYIVPSAIGYIEDSAPRMVKTPWYDEEIPFNMAAEIGTHKVISEHSTIGIVVTTDGSITDIPREEYETAEKRVVQELHEINKPFVIVLNTTHPNSAESQALCASMQQKYRAPVCAVNCLDLTESEILSILEKVLLEFPVCEINVTVPKWMMGLDRSNPIRKSIFSCIQERAKSIRKIGEVSQLARELLSCEYINNAGVRSIALGSGCATLYTQLNQELFYKVLSDVVGFSIHDEASLMDLMKDLSSAKYKYDKIQHAMDEVEAKGYGIVMPTVDEMELDEPEIIKQNGRYGIRLRASAPSIHMMKANIQTEVSPIVGSERQSEELVAYLLREFEENPSKIWDSNIFGSSLYGLVNEGLHNKLLRMPDDARMKLKDTVEQIINEGCNGLICIIV